MDFSLQSVLDHYGLHKRPFTLVPDPNFLFLSSQHSIAQAALNYGIASFAPITLLTGEIGAGKTTILRELLTRTSPDIHLGLIANAVPADRVEMLRLVLFALGETAADTNSYANLYAQLESFVVDEYREGRRIILIFDEAQNLNRSSLEHLRMLTNINFGEHELIQLVLIGHPELLETLRRPDLRQLAQRISAHVVLSLLKLDDVEAYIKYRLKIAGVDRDLFEPESYQVIFEKSGGVPRVVNQICDYSLLYAYGNDEGTVSAAVVEKVITDGFILGVGDGNPLLSNADNRHTFVGERTNPE